MSTEVIWRGCLYVKCVQDKEVFACTTDMTAFMPIHRPDTIDGSLKLNYKTSLSDGFKRFLHEIPYLARDTENYWSGLYYNCCLLTPRTQYGKFSSVVKYLEDGQLIGLVKLRDGGVMLMTDNKLTERLGLPHIDGLGLHCITVTSYSCLKEPGTKNGVTRQGPGPSPQRRPVQPNSRPSVLLHIPDLIPESLGGDWRTMLTHGTDLTEEQRFPNAFIPVKSECDAAPATSPRLAEGNHGISVSESEIQLPWMNSLAELKVEPVSKSAENDSASSSAGTGVPSSSGTANTPLKIETGNINRPKSNTCTQGTAESMKVEQRTEPLHSPNTAKLKKVTVLLKDLETEMDSYQRAHGNVIANMSNRSSPATSSVAVSGNASVGTDDEMETEQTTSVLGYQSQEPSATSLVQNTKTHRTSSSKTHRTSSPKSHRTSSPKTHRTSSQERSFSPKRKSSKEKHESKSMRKKERKSKDDSKAGHSSKHKRKKHKHSYEPISGLDKKNRVKSWVHANKYKDAKQVLADLDLGLKKDVVKSLGRIPKKNQQPSTSSSPLCDRSWTSAATSAKSSPSVMQNTASTVSKHGDAPENNSDDGDAVFCEGKAVEPVFISEMGDIQLDINDDGDDENDDDKKMKLFDGVMHDEPRDCIPGIGDWDQTSVDVTRAVARSVEKGLLVSLLASNGMSILGNSLLLGKTTVEDAVASILHGDRMGVTVPPEDNMTVMYVNQVLHHPVSGTDTKRSVYFVVENKVKRCVVSFVSTEFKSKPKDGKVLHTDEVTAKLLSIVSGGQSGHWKYGSASKEPITDKIHDNDSIAQLDEPCAVASVKKEPDETVKKEPDDVEKEPDDILDVIIISDDENAIDELGKDTVTSEIRSPKMPHVIVIDDISKMPETSELASKDQQLEPVVTDTISNKNSLTSSQPVLSHSSLSINSNLSSKDHSKIVQSSGEKTEHVPDVHSDRIASKERSPVVPGSKGDTGPSSEKPRHSSSTERHCDEMIVTVTVTESRNSSEVKAKHSSGSKEKVERSSRESSVSSGRDKSERSSTESSRHSTLSRDRSPSRDKAKVSPKTEGHSRSLSGRDRSGHSPSGEKPKVSPKTEGHSRSSSERDRSRRSPSKEQTKFSESKNHNQSSRTDNTSKKDASTDSSSKDIGSRLEKLSTSTVSRSEHRQSRQYHPYRKETKHSRYTPTWSFDIAYRDMDELLQNMTENIFKQKGRKPAPDSSWKKGSGNRHCPRFRRFEFRRSEVPRTLPKWIQHTAPEEETEEISPDNIPDLEDRVRRADMVEEFISKQENQEDATPEVHAYTNNETEEADRRVIIATCTGLNTEGSLPTVSPGSQAPVSPGGQAPVSQDQVLVSPGDTVSVSSVPHEEKGQLNETSAELSSIDDTVTSVDHCSDREIEKKLETYLHSIDEAVIVKKTELVNTLNEEKIGSDVVVKQEIEEDQENFHNDDTKFYIEKKLETYIHSIKEKESVNVMKTMFGTVGSQKEFKDNNGTKIGPDVIKLDLEEHVDSQKMKGKDMDIEKEMETCMQTVLEEAIVKEMVGYDSEQSDVCGELENDCESNKAFDILLENDKKLHSSPKTKLGNEHEISEISCGPNSGVDTYAESIDKFLSPKTELGYEKELDKVCDGLEMPKSNVNLLPQCQKNAHEEKKIESAVCKNIFSSESDVCLDWTDDEVDKSKDESFDSDGNTTFIVVDIADSSDVDKQAQSDIDDSDMEIICLSDTICTDLEHADKTTDSDFDLTTVECIEVVDSRCEENESGISKLYITVDECTNDELSFAVNDADQTLLAADDTHSSSNAKETSESDQQNSAHEQINNNLGELQICHKLNTESVEKELKSSSTELDEKSEVNSTALYQKPEQMEKGIDLSNVLDDERNSTSINMSESDTDQSTWSRGINCSSSSTSVIIDSNSNKEEAIMAVVDESAVQKECARQDCEKTNKGIDLYVLEQTVEKSIDSRPMALARENCNDTGYADRIIVGHDLNVSGEDVIVQQEIKEDEENLQNNDTNIIEGKLETPIHSIKEETSVNVMKTIFETVRSEKEINVDNERKIDPDDIEQDIKERVDSSCLENLGSRYVDNVVDGDTINQNNIQARNELSGVEVIPSSCAEDTSDMDSEEEFPALRDCITLSTAVDHEDKVRVSVQQSYQTLNDGIDSANRAEVVESSETRNETVSEPSSPCLQHDDVSKNRSGESDRNCKFVAGESNNRKFEQYHQNALSRESLVGVQRDQSPPHPHTESEVDHEKCLSEGNKIDAHSSEYKKENATGDAPEKLHVNTVQVPSTISVSVPKLDVESPQLEIELPQLLQTNDNTESESNSHGELILEDRVEEISAESHIPKDQPAAVELTNKCENIGMDNENQVEFSVEYIDSSQSTTLRNSKVSGSNEQSSVMKCSKYSEDGLSMENKLIDGTNSLKSKNSNKNESTKQYHRRDTTYSVDELEEMTAENTVNASLSDLPKCKTVSHTTEVIQDVNPESESAVVKNNECPDQTICSTVQTQCMKEKNEIEMECLSNDTETKHTCTETEESNNDVDGTERMCLSTNAAKEPLYLQVMVNGNLMKLTDYEELTHASKSQHNSMVCGLDDPKNENTNQNDSVQEDACSVLGKHLEQEPSENQRENCSDTSGGISNENSQREDISEDFDAQGSDFQTGSADIIWNGKILTQEEYEKMFSREFGLSVENDQDKDGGITKQDYDHVDKGQMDCSAIETEKMIEKSSATNTSYQNNQTGLCDSFGRAGKENLSLVDLPKRVPAVFIDNAKNWRPSDDKTCPATAIDYSNSESTHANTSIHALTQNNQGNEKNVENKVVAIESFQEDSKTNCVTEDLNNESKSSTLSISDVPLETPDSTIVTQSASFLKGNLASAINGLGMLCSAYTDNRIVANKFDKSGPSQSSKATMKLSGAEELVIEERESKVDVQEENHGSSAGLTNTLKEDENLNSLQLLCSEYDDTDTKACTDDMVYSDISEAEVNPKFREELFIKSEIDAEVKSDVLAVDKNNLKTIPPMVECSSHNFVSEEFLTKAVSEDIVNTSCIEDRNKCYEESSKIGKVESEPERQLLVSEEISKEVLSCSETVKSGPKNSADTNIYKNTTPEPGETILDISDESDVEVKDDHIESAGASDKASSAYTLEKVAQLNSLELLGKEYDNRSAMDLVRAYSPEEHDDEESTTESDLGCKNNSEQVLLVDDSSKMRSQNCDNNEELDGEHEKEKTMKQSKELKDLRTDRIADDAEIAFDEMYCKSKWQNLSSSSESLPSNLDKMATAHEGDSNCYVSGNMSSCSMEGNSAHAALMSTELDMTPRTGGYSSSDKDSDEVGKQWEEMCLEQREDIAYDENRNNQKKLKKKRQNHRTQIPSQIPYQGTQDFMEREIFDASSDISVERLNEKNTKEGSKCNKMNIYQTKSQEKMADFLSSLASPISRQEKPGTMDSSHRLGHKDVSKTKHSKKERGNMIDETPFISSSSSQSVLSNLSSCSVEELLKAKEVLQRLLDEKTASGRPISDSSCSDTVDDTNSTPERYIQNSSSVRKSVLSSSVDSRQTSTGSEHSNSSKEENASIYLKKKIENKESSKKPFEKKVVNEKISLRDHKSKKMKRSDEENESGLLDANSDRSRKAVSGLILPAGDSKYKYTLRWLDSVPRGKNDSGVPLKSEKSFKEQRPNRSSKNHGSFKQSPNRSQAYLSTSSSASHSSKPKYNERRVIRVTGKSVSKRSCKSKNDAQSSSDDYQKACRYGSEKLEMMQHQYKDNAEHTAASHFLRQGQFYDSDLDYSLVTSSPFSKKSVSSSFSGDDKVSSRQGLCRNDGRQAVTTGDRRSNKGQATDYRSVVFLHPSTLRIASTVDMMHLVKAMGRCSDSRHCWILALFSSQWRSLEKEKKMMKQEKLCYHDTVQLVPDHEGSFTSIETLAKQTLRADPSVKKVYIINESPLDHYRDRGGLVQCSLAEFLDFHLAAV